MESVSPQEIQAEDAQAPDDQPTAESAEPTKVPDDESEEAGFESATDEGADDDDEGLGEDEHEQGVGPVTAPLPA